MLWEVQVVLSFNSGQSMSYRSDWGTTQHCSEAWGEFFINLGILRWGKVEQNRHPFCCLDASALLKCTTTI